MTAIARNLISLIGALAACSLSWSSTAQMLTGDPLSALRLDDVSRMARANRGEVGAAIARADALAQRPAIVGSLEDPMISPSIDHYPFDMMEEMEGEENGRRYDWSLTFEQSFPLSGVRSHRRRAAQAEAARADADAARVALDVVLEAQRAFFMLHERRQMRVVLDEQLELARRLVSSAAARYASGTGLQADVLRAEVETARVQAEQRALTARMRAAESMLNVSMGLPADAPVGELEYEPGLLDLLPVAALKDRALADRPELRAGEAEIARAQADIDVMRSMYSPMATIRAGPAATMAEGDGAMLMVGVSVPIWRSKLRAGVAEARAMERMARADFTAMQLMIAGETAAARAEVQAARETFQALQSEVIPRAAMAVDAGLASYSSGQGTLVSSVEALGALWRARGELVMAESAYGRGTLAEVRVVTGPPMIKDENGVLVGYVFADINGAERDLGGWVSDAKRLVDEQLELPTGFRLQWTGQYEFMADMQARMRFVLPLTLVLIVSLLYLSLRGWVQTWLVLLSLPFAIAGSVWLLALLDYNLSTAVWVGLIAVGGVAAQTGIVVIVYLDQAFREWRAQGRIRAAQDVDQAVVEGAAKCLRPMLMTVATTVLGLAPLLFESGVGADLSARTAAPVVGGLWSCMFLTLLVLPAVYAIWRRRQIGNNLQSVTR